METELEAEQDFVDLAYARLDAMRSDANSMLEGVLDLGRGGTFQSRTERDVIVRTSLARLEQLDIGDQALTFGRIDRLADRSGRPDRPERERRPRHVEHRDLPHRSPGHPRCRPRAAGGRLAGAGGRALLPGHRPRPPGLVLRRHLALQGRRWSASRTSASPVPETATDTGRASRRRRRGRAELPVGRAHRGRSPHRRPRRPAGRPGPGPVGPDDRHRLDHPGASRTRSSASPLSGVLVVQGGPGTGKTAVALHRAAYLLYTHRFPLERQGVLVVGPNPLFLRYIEQVLPSLGETGVTLSTVSGLVPEIRVRETGPVDVARLKGDARMATGRRPRRADPPAAAVRGRRPSPTGPWCSGCRPRTPARIVEGGPPPARHPQRPPPPGRAVGGPGAGRPGPPDPAAPRGRGAVVGHGLPRLRGPVRARRRRVRLRGLLAQGAAGAGAGRGPRPDVAAALPPRAAPRPLRRAAADRRGRPGGPVPRGAGPAPAPPVDLVRRGGLDAGRRRAGRRGPPPARPAQRRRRRGGAQVRPHRGRRGPGPLADAAADAHPALAGGLDDRGRRHRPGHRPVGSASWDDIVEHLPQPPAGPDGRADRELPDAGRGAGRGRPGPGGGRSRPHPAHAGAAHRGRAHACCG